MGRRNKQLSNWHPAKRAGERYGMSLTDSDINALTNQIKRGHAVLLNPTGETGTSVWLVSFRGIKLRALYRDQVGAIVTFLKARAYRSGAQDDSCTP